MEVIEFKNVLGQTCNYMTISNILKHYGFDVPEEYVFLLLKSQYKKDMDINIPFFSRNTFRKIGFELRDYQFKDLNEFNTLVHKLTLSNVPIIANVNTKGLSYFPQNINGIEEHPHIVIIHGYKDQHVLLSDVYVPFYPPECFTGWIEEVSIYNAISNSNDPGKLFTLNMGDNVIINQYEIFESCFVEIINTLIKENLQRKMEAEYNSQLCDKVEGCEAIISHITQDDMKSIARKTRTEWLSFEGPAQTRDFLVKILISVQNYHTDYERYAKDMKVFYQRWNAMANALIKFTVIFNAKYFKYVNDLYLKLLEEETQYMKNLKNEVLNLVKNTTYKIAVMEVDE